MTYNLTYCIISSLGRIAPPDESVTDRRYIPGQGDPAQENNNRGRKDLRSNFIPGATNGLRV